MSLPSLLLPAIVLLPILQSIDRYMPAVLCFDRVPLPHPPSIPQLNSSSFCDTALNWLMLDSIPVCSHRLLQVTHLSNQLLHTNPRLPTPIRLPFASIDPPSVR